MVHVELKPVNPPPFLLRKKSEFMSISAWISKEMREHSHLTDLSIHLTSLTCKTSVLVLISEDDDIDGTLWNIHTVYCLQTENEECKSWIVYDLISSSKMCTETTHSV